MAIPKIRNGKRILLCGSTGSGKSQWLRYLINGAKQHVLILDVKGEFSDYAIPTSDFDDAVEQLFDSQYVVYQPPRSRLQAKELDAMIGDLADSVKNICLAIDEAYSIHSNGRAGNGLVAWLTRGRSLGQSTVACTQRPSWISQMMLSESETVGAGMLRIAKDRVKLAEATGCDDFRHDVPSDHSFRFYDGTKSKLYQLEI